MASSLVRCFGCRPKTTKNRALRVKFDGKIGAKFSMNLSEKFGANFAHKFSSNLSEISFKIAKFRTLNAH